MLPVLPFSLLSPRIQRIKTLPSCFPIHGVPQPKAHIQIISSLGNASMFKNTPGYFPKALPAFHARRRTGKPHGMSLAGLGTIRQKRHYCVEEFRAASGSVAGKPRSLRAARRSCARFRLKYPKRLTYGQNRVWPEVGYYPCSLSSELRIEKELSHYIYNRVR